LASGEMSEMASTEYLHSYPLLRYVKALVLVVALQSRSAAVFWLGQVHELEIDGLRDPPEQSFVVSTAK
jgi:hypothetical protein